MEQGFFLDRVYGGRGNHCIVQSVERAVVIATHAACTQLVGVYGASPETDVAAYSGFGELIVEESFFDGSARHALDSVHLNQAFPSSAGIRGGI